MRRNNNLYCVILVLFGFGIDGSKAAEMTEYSKQGGVECPWFI